MANKSVQDLSSRNVVGALQLALEQDTGPAWVDRMSFLVETDREQETYRWLGQTPMMRKWLGTRLAKGLRAQGFTLKNQLYEATLEVDIDDMRRDRFSFIMQRIDELAVRAGAHWASLLTTLIIAGEDTVCYDGQFYFDIDHDEGDSGSQDNDITTDISALPVPADQQGSITDPSAKIMKLVALLAIQQMLGFVDDQGEPLNETANEFIVMGPTTFANAMDEAFNNTQLFSETNRLAGQGPYTVTGVPNARLTWTDQIAVFRVGPGARPLIRQSEFGPNVSAIAEGSELEFNDRKHHYGIDASRAVDYGYWQHACLIQMT